MALAKRPAYNSGFDKKHDLPQHSQQWRSAHKMRPWTMFRKRRVLLVFAVLAAAYFFIKYLPTDVPSVAHRVDSRTGRSQARPLALNTNPKTTSSKGHTAQSKQIYDGPVKFYSLAGTLRRHLHKNEDGKDNVVFMLHDLRSAATLTQLACEMALHNRTTVHMALVAMHDSEVEDILAVSGIQQENCPVFWHDARPDFNLESSVARQAIVVKSAADHLRAALRPAVFLIDQRHASNGLFRLALQAILDERWIPLAIVPNDALASVNWLTRLDGKALSMLNQNQIDVVITPYKQSAGSLIRLLESIRQAHYTGLSYPRITVELPQNIDGFARRYLDSFRWPSDSHFGENKLVLRRNLSADKLSRAVASLRTVESFYPLTSPMSHVLVLSPDVELSPDYLQYLTYLTLEYKYGSSGQRITGSLNGISLDLPQNALNDEDPFIVTQPPDLSPLLLSQTPSCTAALYFGDKWVELQDYLSLRLKYDPELEKNVHTAPQISQRHPSWLRQVSELMQVRNYYMLYPGFARNPSTRLVTVHEELHQDPEEFWEEPKKDLDSTDSLVSALSQDHILTAEEDLQHPHANMQHEESVRTVLLSSVLKLGAGEGLPSDSDVPLYSAHGKLTSGDESYTAAEAFADRVSLELGPCNSLGDRDDEATGRLDYLFCEYHEL